MLTIPLANESNRTSRWFVYDRLLPSYSNRNAWCSLYKFRSPDRKNVSPMPLIVQSDVCYINYLIHWSKSATLPYNNTSPEMRYLQINEFIAPFVPWWHILCIRLWSPQDVISLVCFGLRDQYINVPLSNYARAYDVWFVLFRCVVVYP